MSRRSGLRAFNVAELLHTVEVAAKINFPLELLLIDPTDFTEDLSNREIITLPGLPLTASIFAHRWGEDSYARSNTIVLDILTLVGRDGRGRLLTAYSGPLRVTPRSLNNGSGAWPGSEGDQVRGSTQLSLSLSVHYSNP